MAGGVAVIKVGAQSEIEMKEKKDRIDDALLATKAAVEEGIVVGGGAALIHAKQLINGSLNDETQSDKSQGVSIILDACEAPFKAIMENAGLKSDVLLDRFHSSPSDVQSTIGYNVVTEEFCDLIDSGIIDPTKVSRTALEKAVSVAGTLLTTECMVVNEPEDNE